MSGDETTRAAYLQERERLLRTYRQRLDEAPVADHEAIWQEYVEGQARLAQRYNGRFSMRFLLYCTEWDPHKGGIVAVNRNLAEGLAEAGHEVFVRVGHEVTSYSPGDRIHLIGPRQYDPGRGEQEQLDYDGEELPSRVDAIIGHSRYSGPAALRVRDQLYPDTPFVHTIHMVTGALARVADRPDLEVEFEGIERRMTAAADMVLGIGPVLENEARRLVATNPGDHLPRVASIIPGVPFEEQRLLPWDGERPRNVLFVGRADAPQQGAHHAALMVRRLREEGLDVRLTVRGAAPQILEQIRGRLEDISGSDVAVKPFTNDRNEILADMRAADVMVMPSQAEGFGLVGLEALGAGLPILVPDTSGVGAFLGDPNRFPPEVTRRSLVEQGFEDHVYLPRWTSKLREILLDIPAAREDALTLQRLLRESGTTWVGAAESLAAAVQAIPDRSAPRPAAPRLPATAEEDRVNCARGHEHRGRYGAAGLLLVHRAANGEAHVLMRRGPDTGRGETWTLLGGERNSHESAAEAALRGAAGRGAFDTGGLRVERVVRDDHGGWSYSTVVASVDQQVPVPPVEGEPAAPAWVPLSEVQDLELHPDLAANWPRVQAELGAVLNGTPPAADAVAVTPSPLHAIPLPPHPVTGARVTARETLARGSGIANRELVTFSDGARAVYEKYERTEDARDRVLGSRVGQAVGARVPLSHPLGLREVYTDHMPGEPAGEHYRDLAEIADRGLPATRDGVLLGLYYALTAVHGVTADQIVLGEQQSLIPAGDGAASYGPRPDAENPFVRVFYRQVDPHVFDWVDNPVPRSDIAVMRRRLDGLRPLFSQFGRSDLYTAVMERFDRVAEHANGTDPLLSRAPGERVALPEPVSRRRPLPPPLSSQERAEQQRIGEALLSEDGRITHTSEAKTIAIQAVAARMSLSTPELALAAFGLTVGTDMVGKLGEGDHVLVPHHAQYPSLGADVLHVSELDQNNPRHAPDRVVRMDTPYADTLVRWIAVSELMHAWAYGSNNNVRVLAMQEAAKEEFGLTGVLEWRVAPEHEEALQIELAYNRGALREFLSTQHTLTQEVLASRRITEVVAYRAMTWAEGAVRPDWADADVGDAVEIRHRPLASWSVNRQTVVDWLEQRGGPGVVLADRVPAEYVLAVSATGIGFFGQQEVVVLPGDRPVILDGSFAGRSQETAVEQTAASSVTLGAPALDEAAENRADNAVQKTEPAPREADDRWRPLTVTDSLDPTDPTDRWILRVLDGEEKTPGWWPRDDSGYAITKRDLEFLGVNPVQLKWMLTGEAPLGMTPQLYQQFCAEMLEALQRDGIAANQVDIRIKGTGAGFFAGKHKALPGRRELADNPEAAQRFREWLGDSQDRPRRRPYDLMWRLGLEAEPSDIDLDINSTAMVRAAREHWRTRHSDRFSGDFMGGHGYLEKQTVTEVFPALAEWADRWKGVLGRPLSLGVFESSGPFNAEAIGRTISSHYRDTDWIIHSPAKPLAWRRPESRITARPIGAPDAVPRRSGPTGGPPTKGKGEGRSTGEVSDAVRFTRLDTPTRGRLPRRGGTDSTAKREGEDVRRNRRHGDGRGSGRGL